MSRFHPYHTLDWLDTLLATDNVYRKLIDYKSGSASFNVAIKISNDRSFSDDHLSLLGSETPDQVKSPSLEVESTKLYTTVK